MAEGFLDETAFEVAAVAVDVAAAVVGFSAAGAVGFSAAVDFEVSLSFCFPNICSIPLPFDFLESTFGSVLISGFLLASSLTFGGSSSFNRLEDLGVALLLMMPLNAVVGLNSFLQKKIKKFILQC